MSGREAVVSLLCRAGSVLCAFPLEHVVEILRPLPVDPLPNVPGFVAGAAIVRGTAMPVVSVARILQEAVASPARFVVVRVGERRVALAVDAVVGCRSAFDVAELPPLLRDASRDAVDAIGTLDGELLLVLEAARVVTDAVLAAVETTAEAA